MTSAGAGSGGSACDSCHFARRQDDVPARRDAARTGSRRPTACTTARATCTWSTPTRSDPTGRSTRAPASPARRRMSTGHIDDRRDSWRETRARAVRSAQSLEGVRGLRLHPGVCGGMRRGVAHNAWRHEHADMSQAQLRIGAHLAGTYVASALQLGAHEDHCHQEGLSASPAVCPIRRRHPGPRSKPLDATQRDLGAT